MITKLSAFKHLLERSLQDKKFKYKVITYTITAVHIFFVFIRLFYSTSEALLHICDVSTLSNMDMEKS